ncbi:hypothetical protein [Spiroplasma endosymbiont of Othius punctulatus]|uniref:hypothetical protein n=1 Tax=Spiroplasma endosymbiont of Othius punctulatus TaxID=3066289 RepID=UPI0030CD929F
MQTIYEMLLELRDSQKNFTFKQIATNLIEFYKHGEFENQEDFAKRNFVSISTLTKFAKSLNLSGYRELIIRLKVESEIEHNKMKSTVNPGQGIKFDVEVLQNITQWIVENSDTINKITDLLLNNKRINFYISPAIANSCKNFSETLAYMGYSTKIYNVAMYSGFTPPAKLGIDEVSDVVNFIIISGPNILSFFEIFEKNLNTNFEKNILMSSPTKVKSIKIESNTKLLFNAQSDDSSFLYRNTLLENLFLIISTKLIVSLKK